MKINAKRVLTVNKLLLHDDLAMRGYSTAEVVKMLRSRQGERSQKAFAAEVGVTQQYLCDVFLGKRGPGKKFLDYLGLEVGYIKSERAA